MATRMGKIFKTRKGRIGCYKYVNGRRVAFVTKKRKNFYRGKYRKTSMRFNKPRQFARRRRY